MQPPCLASPLNCNLYMCNFRVHKFVYNQSVWLCRSLEIKFRPNKERQMKKDRYEKNDEWQSCAWVPWKLAIKSFRI